MNLLNQKSHHIIELDMNGVREFRINNDNGEILSNFDLPPLNEDLELEKVASVVLGCHDQEVSLYHKDTFRLAREAFPKWFRPASGVLAVILDNKLMGKGPSSLEIIMDRTGYSANSVKYGANTLKTYLKGGWEIEGRQGYWTVFEPENSSQK